MSIGPWEIGGILLIVILLFGAKKLPELARSMGEGIREFKKGVAQAQQDDEKTDKQA